MKNVAIPHDLHIRMKVVASSQGISLREFIALAIEKQLAKANKKK